VLVGDLHSLFDPAADRLRGAVRTIGCDLDIAFWILRHHGLIHSDYLSHNFIQHFVSYEGEIAIYGAPKSVR
jgi:hypothetical protein